MRKIIFKINGWGSVDVRKNSINGKEYENKIVKPKVKGITFRRGVIFCVSRWVRLNEVMRENLPRF